MEAKAVVGPTANSLPQTFKLPWKPNPASAMAQADPESLSENISARMMASII